MKYLILITSLTFLTSNSFAQDDELGTPVSITETITTQKNKNEIYLASRLWFYKTFNSYEGVVNVEDYENGVIYAKGILPIYVIKKKTGDEKTNSVATGDVYFNLRFYFDEGKYKIIFDNLIHKYYSNGADSGFGLLTDSETPTRLSVGWKMVLRNWKLTVDTSTITIRDVIEDLKMTIENENEMKY